MRAELFPIVDDEGNVTGHATRQKCHAGSFLLHPVVHLHVFNTAGKIFLQKRADNKDIQPGKWDTSVGGHVDLGETTEEALQREVCEELGITSFVPVFIHRYKFISDVEAELVHSYYTIYDGVIKPDPDEIAEGKFWALTDIENNLGKSLFTPNFEYEFSLLTKNKLIPVM